MVVEVGGPPADILDFCYATDFCESIFETTLIGLAPTISSYNDISIC